MRATTKPHSVDSKILNRVRRYGQGAVFVPSDFLDLGSRRAVDIVLHRLARKGTIRRLAHGIYGYPEIHPTLGALMPSPDKVAKALSGRDLTRLQPAGAYAANLLGMSEQVPTKLVFLTDGSSKLVHIGPMTIELRHTTPRNIAAADRLSGLLIQALRHIGKDQVTDEQITQLRKSLPMDQRRALIKDLNLAPAWMRSILQDVAET